MALISFTSKLFVSIISFILAFSTPDHALSMQGLFLYASVTSFPHFICLLDKNTKEDYK